MTYPIKGFNPHTFIDWEGKLAAVIYLPGCNFRCPFCHSSSLVLKPESLTTIPFEHVERFLDEKEGWIDAVIVGGGEPTLYSQLPLLLKDIKNMDLLVKLDTNGTNPLMLKDIIDKQLVDYVAMDIKAPLNKDKDERITRMEVDIEAIRRSIKILLDSGIDHEFRTTVVPTFIESKDIMNIAQEISGAPKYVLQQFDPQDTLDKTMWEIKPYSVEILRKNALLASEFVKKCLVRGA